MDCVGAGQFAWEGYSRALRIFSLDLVLGRPVAITRLEK